MKPCWWSIKQIALVLSLYALTPLPLQAQAISNTPGTANSRQPMAHQSGNAFLSEDLRRMQSDASLNPVQLWLDQGHKLWGTSSQNGACFACHGEVQKMKAVAIRYPQWSDKKQGLVNLEDQILTCTQRTPAPHTSLEHPDVLALSAVLHQASVGLSYQLQPTPSHQDNWQTALTAGAQQFTTRMGRMNLSCTHCHDQLVGRQMRADVISPGHPTGFPIFKMSWQSMGSIDRRLRACFSGVQADVPVSGSQALRQLELFMKVRAQGLPVDGPALRR